jgi:predicted Rossmann-fold nucleotide-binding protein
LGNCDIVDVLRLRKHLRKGVGVPSLHNDPEHWRKRAKEARALAEKMTDAVSKKAMMEVAEKYDEVAARAVERLAKRTPQSK